MNCEKYYENLLARFTFFRKIQNAYTVAGPSEKQ